MGNQQVRPAPARKKEEEVTQFLSSIPQLDCYTSTEPTFKDCFIARESWANVKRGRIIRLQHLFRNKTSRLSTYPEEREEKRNGCVSKEELAPAVDSLMVFFSLFFEKQAVLNPESKLLCSTQRGYFLNNLVSILLMGATSKPKMEWFLLTYSYVGLSEYGHIGEALMRALDATISASFEDSGMGGVNNSKKNKSAGKCIVRAWNRIYSRFLRSLSGSVPVRGSVPMPVSVSVSGSSPDYQGLEGIPQGFLAKPQQRVHSFKLKRSRSSPSFPGPDPDSSGSTSDSPAHSCASPRLSPKSVDWISSQKRLLYSEERKANGIHTVILTKPSSVKSPRIAECEKSH
mmetsp:Transcript_26205/g.58001  ORF Transcript_26205/g.58001 Transcript_26205/m.58001 type:complete len:344 (-) Transcript_26205:248-1279(-)